LLQGAMSQAGDDRALAAKLLGVTRRSLRYLISKHGVGASVTKFDAPGKKMSES
jgi:transcriptional regulator with GAF, ATPase, and Fis domain